MSISMTTPTGAKAAKAKMVAWWVTTGLLACVYLLSGSMKFVSPQMAEQFAQWGYADWFRVVIGVIEIGGGLALLVPRIASYAAGALGIVMVGAAFTHLSHGEVSQAIVPFVLLIILLMVGYARRPCTTS